MDMAFIEKELHRRIDQSREWLSGKPALIKNLKIRNFPCQAEPVKFLDDPHMKARHGVMFRIEFVTERGTFEAYLETFIMPTKSLRKDEKFDPPFVACYAFNPETKKRDLITWDFVENIAFYKSNLDTFIEEWYKGWVFKALIHKKVSKIFNLGFNTMILS